MKKIAVIAIEHPFLKGLFLHGKRKDSGKWCLPGGHGLDGELPAETAHRELKEETGLDVREMEACRNGCFEGPVENEGVQVHLFRAQPQEGVTVDHTVDPDGEFSEFRYINPLVNSDMHVPAVRNILIHFLQDGQKIQKAEPKLPPKRAIFDDPWDQEKYDRGGEEEWEEYWEQEKLRRQKYYEDKFGPLKKTQSGSKDKDAEIQHQVMNSLPDLGDVKKKIETLGAKLPPEFERPDSGAIFTEPLKLHQLYRAYKHTPHQPISLLLKYAIHRMENRGAYTQADEATKDKLDSDFMDLHQRGGAADKNGHVLMPHLHYALHGHPHILGDLLQHQRELHDKVKTQAAWAIHNLDNEPHVALTRGLHVQRSERGLDHALASYADQADPGFGSVMHHQFVPLKNLWYSFDAGPKEATSLKFGNENEYLVSPHKNLYQDVRSEPSKTAKIFPDSLHNKLYSEADQLSHRIKNDRMISWDELLDPEGKIFDKAGIPHKERANMISNMLTNKPVKGEHEMRSVMGALMKFPTEDAEKAVYQLNVPLSKYLENTNQPIDLKWADWLHRAGSRSQVGRKMITDLFAKHFSSGNDFKDLSPDRKHVLLTTLSTLGDTPVAASNPALGTIARSMWNDPESRKYLESNDTLSGIVLRHTNGMTHSHMLGYRGDNEAGGFKITPEEREALTQKLFSNGQSNGPDINRELTDRSRSTKLSIQKSVPVLATAIFNNPFLNYQARSVASEAVTNSPHSTTKDLLAAAKATNSVASSGFARDLIGHPNFEATPENLAALKDALVTLPYEMEHETGPAIKEYKRIWKENHHHWVAQNDLIDTGDSGVIIPSGALKKFEDLEKKLVFEGNPTVPHREVWRVQNERGQGPYTGAKEEDWRETSHNDFAHPTPHQDRFDPQDLDAMTDFHQIPGSVKHENPVFGFESENQMKKWFSPVELARLGKLGFKPTKMKARKVWSSGTQAFFLPHHEEIRKSWTGKIPGAVTLPKGPSEFPPEKVREGMAVEAEHTKVPELQAEIAAAHLNEDEIYYPKLRVAEGEIGPRDKLRKLIRKKA